MTHHKSEPRPRTKSSSATTIKAGATRRGSKRTRKAARRAMKQPLPRAFIGLDGAGGMTTVVLDETGSFSATENFVAVPATSLRVEEISTGARLIEIDLSGQALNNKFYRDKIRSQALQFTKHTTDMAVEFGHRVIGTTSELGKKVASEIGHRVTETTSDLRKKADSAIGPKAVETAIVLGKKAADKASEIGHKVGETISAISKQAADSPIGHKAIETASELTKKTAEMVATLARKTFEKGTLAQQSAEGQREEKAATTNRKGKGIALEQAASGLSRQEGGRS